MSGKRQHYIPRFLQGGFASEVRDGQAYAWVYRKDSQPFYTNLINIGVEGKFYSAGDGVEVDDAITDAEVDLSRLVSNLRSDALGQIRDKKPISELIAHLEVRARHIRQNVFEASSRLMEELKRFCKDDSAFPRYLRHRIARDDSFLKGPVGREFKDRNLPASQVPKFLQVYKPQILKKLDEELPNLRRAALIVLENVTAQIVNGQNY